MPNFYMFMTAMDGAALHSGKNKCNAAWQDERESKQ